MGNIARTGESVRCGRGGDADLRLRAIETVIINMLIEFACEHGTESISRVVIDSEQQLVNALAGRGNASSGAVVRKQIQEYFRHFMADLHAAARKISPAKSA